MIYAYLLSTLAIVSCYFFITVGFKRTLYNLYYFAFIYPKIIQARIFINVIYRIYVSYGGEEDLETFKFLFITDLEAYEIIDLVNKTNLSEDKLKNILINNAPKLCNEMNRLERLK